MSKPEAAILENTEEANVTVVIDENTPTTVRPKPKQPYIPEGSQKRVLSVNSTPSPSLVLQEGKRFRHQSLEFDDDILTITDHEMEPEQEVTMTDLLSLLKQTAKITDLDDVAKKSDLVSLQETVNSHALEIKQLREDMALQMKRIQELENSVGGQAAKNFNRTQPDTNNFRQSQYGGPQTQNIRFDQRSKNLVFVGVPPLSEPELEPYILQLCTALSIITFPSDIESLVVMTRRDPTSLRPPPILVTFDKQHVRIGLLKHRLANMEKYRDVYINPDEPIEVQRNKATFRKSPTRQETMARRSCLEMIG